MTRPTLPFVGTAGWSIPQEVAPTFPGDGQHLARYARLFSCAEIDTSFHRSHRVETYARWAAQTPADFRFSVKLPRTITHDGRLRGAREPLARFLDEVAGLGDRLGVLLIQLPPSLAFETRPVNAFLRLLRARFDGALACEPRHASWFTPAAERAFIAARVARVAADPARLPDASLPGGWRGDAADGHDALLYFRWHGSPRRYWSRYEAAWLSERAAAASQLPTSARRWFIFDNTASGSAIVNALEMRALTRGASA